MSLYELAYFIYTNKFSRWPLNLGPCGQCSSRNGGVDIGPYNNIVINHGSLIGNIILLHPQRSCKSIVIKEVSYRQQVFLRVGSNQRTLCHIYPVCFHDIHFIKKSLIPDNMVVGLSLGNFPGAAVRAAEQIKIA